jgi:hypothetical protein
MDARESERSKGIHAAAYIDVVFYRVNNDVAEIVRVLDGRRDLDEIFAHEP